MKVRGDGGIQSLGEEAGIDGEVELVITSGGEVCVRVWERGGGEGRWSGEGEKGGGVGRGRREGERGGGVGKGRGEVE